MSSAAQFVANQQNAQSSTGPTTEAGKATSSRNAFRHGLASGQIIIPGENPADYEALVAGLHSDHKPQTTTEHILVNGMATHHWLMLRAVRMLSLAMANPESKSSAIALLMRYQNTNDRGFWKALTMLRKVQKERAEEEIGFVSQSIPQPTATPAQNSIPFPKRPAGFSSLPPKRKRRR